VIDPGEDCDPGANPPANDGCHPPGSANECTFISAPASQDRCPGQAIAVPHGTTIVAESAGTSTYGFQDDYAGSCLASSGGTTGGRDRVFQITASASGTLTVSVGYAADGVTSTCATNQQAPDCWPAVLYARSTCATASTELACAAGISGTAVAPAVITFPVTVGTPYWVIVDGFDAQSYGPFNLVLVLQ
jgi:hypothetical protein